MASSISKKRKINNKSNGTANHAEEQPDVPAASAAERLSTLDLRAAEIRSEQDRLQTELLGILKERNSLLAVNRLPIELLSTIFEWTISFQGCASRYRDRSPLNISQVCSEWRSVAFSTPDLWVDIRIGYGSGLSQGFHRDTLVHLKEQLDRTGSVPLHIVYKHQGGQPEPECIEEVVEAVRRESHRIRSLSVVDQVIRNNLFYSLPGHMPQLESLTIAQANTHQVLHLTPYESIPFQLHHHVLRSLTLQHVALQIVEGSTTLEGLQELKLYHSLIQARPQDVNLPGPGDFTLQEEGLSLNIFRQMPNLETLSIKHVYIREPADSLIPLLKLRKLVVLIMEDPPEMGIFTLPMVFESLQMPQLRDLELWGQPIEQLSPQVIFETLASESAQLERLAFRHAVIRSKPFLTLLRQLKGLRILDCLNTTIMRPIIKGLRQQDAATGAFEYCPRLEELHLRALQDNVWINKHLEKTLRARHVAGQPLKKLSVYTLHKVVLRRLRAYVPYIITEDGKRDWMARKDALELCGGIEDADEKFHFQWNRVYYDEAAGIVEDDQAEAEEGDWPEFATSDSSDEDGGGIDLDDVTEILGVDAMLDTSDIEEEEEEEEDVDEAEWSSDADGMTDGDGMTEADGFTEGDASFIGSDPVTDIDFGLM